MTNTNRKQINEFAEQIVQRLSAKEDLGVEIKALKEAAKEQGIDPQALLKVCADLAMEPEKLRKKLALEDLIDTMRGQTDLFRKKGLDDMREAAE